jgi:PKD repeat protein
MSEAKELTAAIYRLVEVMGQGLACRGSNGQPATKEDLEQLKDQIMSAITDFSAKVEANFAIIQTGITNLDAQIQALQNSPGILTPADQAALDKIAADSAALAAAASAPVTVPPTITAIASATPLTGTAPLAVQFSTTGSVDSGGAPLTFSTDFGDKTTVDTTTAPSHTYQLPGTYVAVTTVSNGKTSLPAPAITIVAS